MGTSKSKSSPKGKEWTAVKTSITRNLRGSGNISMEDVASRITSASGVLGGIARSGGASVSRGGSREGGRGAGTGGKVSGRGRANFRKIGTIVRTLGGFGSIIAKQGLDAAIKKIGLPELRDKTATEVVAIIAEHLTESFSGTEGEVLEDALRTSIIEAASLVGDTYSDLERQLQIFIEQEGIESLQELFLVKYIFNSTWMDIEKHVQDKASDGQAFEAFMTAYESLCKDRVKTTIEEISKERSFETIDWFGGEGINFAKKIVQEIRDALKGL